MTRLTSKAWVGSGGGDGFLFMVTSSRIHSLWDISRGVPDIPMRCVVDSHTCRPVECPALFLSFSTTPPNPTVCLSHTHAQCFVSFQKGAQHIAAGTHHFHATRLITTAYEQEPATVTGSSHNKRVPVSEKLVRGVTNLLKVCHVLNTN